MSDNKWEAFASTGKIVDYLEYKGVSSCLSDKNGDINANAKKNNNSQRIGNP